MSSSFARGISAATDSAIGVDGMGTLLVGATLNEWRADGRASNARPILPQRSVDAGGRRMPVDRRGRKLDRER
ncbi:hypothetical protein Sdia_40600 [Streptomyces diastaticus subsp. diastaticus]|uniref:Uncharacterized protein n=2 Tax=Streptomyces diastaticus group TaxID=2849069 RepID=A0A8H9LGX4_9ACTN|nr:hypothetical protein Sdia_40600 [Streptomyces diastaticus subsp. diastaticus]GGU10643.1 hypothetical protein GCM10015534_11370 [Streptomyces diastaticus subsp. diastaticus]GGU52936.1 hypothetical protein GCM10010227_02200 [Streptomyces gougerotii]